MQRFQVAQKLTPLLFFLQVWTDQDKQRSKADRNKESFISDKSAKESGLNVFAK